MKKKRYFFYLTLILLLMNACTTPKQPVDLIVYHAKIYTVDSAFTMATAFAVNQGKFVAVGQDADIMDNYSGKKEVDALGKPIYPGFNDGHSHFLGYGLWLTQYANLVGKPSFNALLEELKQFHAENPDRWILGRGWDQNLWENKSFPDKEELDVLFPNTPVVCIRIDGHAVLANSAALTIARIDENTAVAGGEIIKVKGEVTGVLLDNAADLMKGFIPELTQEQKVNALLLAQKNCFEQGLTTVTDAGLDKDDILLIDSLQKEGQLKIKL